MATCEELRVGMKVEYIGTSTPQLKGARGTVCLVMTSDHTVVCEWDRAVNGWGMTFGVYPSSVRVICSEGRNKL